VKRSSKKYLIVNADDFGQSHGVNRGIIEAHEHGIVTSASLMVRWPAAEEAAAYARHHRKLSLGIHIDLGEWIYRAGAWEPVYTVTALDDEAAVKRELTRQLDIYRSLLGTEPTHINSHQHVHMREPVRSIVLDLAQCLGVPLRKLCPEIHYFTNFYGQTAEGVPVPQQINLEYLVENLATLPNGFTVLVCHPGYADGLNTMYRIERTEELKVLCDPRVREALENLGITLCSFHDWKQLKSSQTHEHV
jgi:predicted glycoside hydrolase/deacetylase ChbG (UPF0249 family)